MAYYAKIRIYRVSDDHYVEPLFRVPADDFVAAALITEAYISGLAVGGIYRGWCRELTTCSPSSLSEAFPLKSVQKVTEYIKHYLDEQESP